MIMVILLIIIDSKVSNILINFDDFDEDKTTSQISEKTTV